MATVTRPIALVGLPALSSHIVHVCKGLEAIWAYIACALLARLA